MITADCRAGSYPERCVATGVRASPARCSAIDAEDGAVPPARISGCGTTPRFAPVAASSNKTVSVSKIRPAGQPGRHQLYPARHGDL